MSASDDGDTVCGRQSVSLPSVKPSSKPSSDERSSA